MKRTRSRRLHALLIWLGFGLATAASALGLLRLHDRVCRGIEEQSRTAEERERQRFLATAEDYLNTVRRSAGCELAGFHVDGLEQSLRNWDTANISVLATFVWSPANKLKLLSGDEGFRPGLEETLPPMVTQLREWRERNPTPIEKPQLRKGTQSTQALRTLDNPAMPEASLGYQSENLDVLAHARRKVDPWLGWAAESVRVGQPWVLWYQSGPGEDVRGCLINTTLLVEHLRAELGDGSSAKLLLTPISEKKQTPGNSPQITLSLLPSHALESSEGNLFAEKLAAAQIDTLWASLTLTLCLGGTLALTLHLRRRSRDAERKLSFVSQVSHELRTPLTSIRLFAELLGAPSLSEEKRLRHAARIHSESERLTALIDRLLDFNALEKGKVKGRGTMMDLHPLLSDSLEQMRPLVERAGLKLECKGLEGELNAFAEPFAIAQALFNLLDNTIKYGAAGGVVSVEIVSDAHLLRLRISDRGPGIPAKIAKQIFEPFFQAQSETHDKAPGLGLGLAIARGMLRQAGADLILLPGGPGAHFEIQVPRQAPRT